MARRMRGVEERGRNENSRKLGISHNISPKKILLLLLAMASLFAARPALATAARPSAPATAASAVPRRAPAARRVQVRRAMEEKEREQGRKQLRPNQCFSVSSPFDLVPHPVPSLPPCLSLSLEQAKAIKPLPRGGRESMTPAALRRPMLARPLVAAPPHPATVAKASLAADGSNDKLLGVEKKTLVKVMALGAMFFSILFNYTILRDTKVSSFFLPLVGGALRAGQEKERACFSSPGLDDARESATLAVVVATELSVCFYLPRASFAFSLFPLHLLESHTECFFRRSGHKRAQRGTGKVARRGRWHIEEEDQEKRQRNQCQSVDDVAPFRRSLARPLPFSPPDSDFGRGFFVSLIVDRERENKSGSFGGSRNRMRNSRKGEKERGGGERGHG